jgi:RND family efflux transporter MFP subunit
MWQWGTMALVVTGAQACGSAQAENGEDGGSADAYVRVINVEVSTVQPEGFVEEIRLTAVAASDKDRLIRPEEPGTVEEVFVRWGDRVTAGQALAKMDDAVLATQVAQARAEAELAAQTWERRRRLWEEDRAGSELAYLEARYAAERSAAALAGLEERLARTSIVAPFTGVVEDVRTSAGSILGQEDAILRLVEIDPIIVHAGVPERYAADVRVGDPVSVVFDALGQAPYAGRVGYVGATVNQDNRTFLILIGVPNPQGRIKPQMVAGVVLTRRAVDEAIVVPQDALVRVEDGYVAFVAVERDGVQVAEVRRVELGPTQRNLVVAESGIEPGDRLIVVGQRSVEDGDRINVVGERG